MVYNQNVILLDCYQASMDTFSAVADPTRRAMLDLLFERERTAGDLVNAFPAISQPAVSKHLRVLRDAGLVSVRVHAQQRIYALQPKPLSELVAWISKYEVFWPKRLDALEEYLSKKKRNEEKNEPKTK